MIMADVLQITLLIVGALLVFISYWLAAEALFPRMVERARHQYATHSILITLLGIVIIAPMWFVGILLAQGGKPVIGIALMGIPWLLGMIGSAGLTQRIGIGLPSALDQSQPWRRQLRGGIVLSLTFLLPFVGWFLVLPWTVVSGLGGLVVAIVTRNKPIAPPPQPAPPVVA
jgi:hypothetical protein